jgi:dTDP-4-amino-4,6-dideoxygalactose transaminase
VEGSDFLNVPFVDLKAQHSEIRAELNQAIEKTLDNTAFILGEEVKRFEDAFAKYCGSKYATGVNSGTAALQLALLAKDVKQGDEIITVSNTFFATTEAISHCNATPVFVDIEEETYNIDPKKIEEAITPKTKAIVPVHLYGQAADMEPIKEIAEKHSLAVVEDACQAHGAEYRGKRMPVNGTACFSFYPSKNLGAIGEGGAVVSDNEEFIEKVTLLRAHGEKPKNVHSRIGFNFRMDGIQAAALNVKLKYLDKWISERRKKAECYNNALQESPVIKPVEKNYGKHAYHLYVIKAEERDKLRKFLESSGISTGIHYLTPIHLQKAYAFLKVGEGSLPVTENTMQKIVSLPMYPELTEEAINFVAEQIKAFY